MEQHGADVSSVRDASPVNRELRLCLALYSSPRLAVSRRELAIHPHDALQRACGVDTRRGNGEGPLDLTSRVLPVPQLNTHAACHRDKVAHRVECQRDNCLRVCVHIQATVLLDVPYSDLKCKRKI